MAEKVELDFSTSGVFWESEDGKKLRRFAQDIYSVMSEQTTTSLSKAGGLLLFKNISAGYTAFKDWVDARLLVLTHSNPPSFTRRELVVAQLTKVLFYGDGQRYQVVFDTLHHNLAQSGLEEHLGNQLNPSFAQKMWVVSLEFNDPWDYDLISLRRGKSSTRRER